MANDVVWYDSSEVGAPTLNNVAGSLIAVLDACLVNGFNAKAITSLVVAGGIATATCAAHGYSGTYGKCVQVAGATPAGLNGRKALLSVTTNTFTFDATGIADQTATGSVTVKRSPLGWVKPFSATNVAMYKSGDLASTGMILRVADTAATAARAIMVESATDIDSYTNPSPTAVQLAGGQYWSKCNNNSTAKAWALVGDGLFFYLFVRTTSAGTFSTQAFGDIVSYRASDTYAGLLAGHTSDIGQGTTSNCPLPVLSNLGGQPGSAGLCLARLSNGIDLSVLCASVGASSGLIGRGTWPIYPSPVDNGMVLHRPVWLAEDNVSAAHPLRGEIPGLAQPLAKQPLVHLGIIDGIVGFAGSMLAIAVVDATAQDGRLFIDLTGPWR